MKACTPRATRCTFCRPCCDKGHPSTCFTKSVCIWRELPGLLRIRVLECGKQAPSWHTAGSPRPDPRHDPASRSRPWTICRLFVEQQFGQRRMHLQLFYTYAPTGPFLRRFLAYGARKLHPVADSYQNPSSSSIPSPIHIRPGAVFASKLLH